MDHSHLPLVEMFSQSALFTLEPHGTTASGVTILSPQRKSVQVQPKLSTDADVVLTLTIGVLHVYLSFLDGHVFVSLMEHLALEN
jgi:hypothetical protein